MGARAGQQEGELIAAGPCRAGTLRCHLVQRLRHVQQHLVAGKMAVKVVQALEMIEVEHEEYPALFAVQSFGDGPHQLAAIGEAGAGIGIRIAMCQPFGGFKCVQRLAQILGTPPTEKNDGNIQQERDLQRIAGVRERQACDCGRKHLAPKRNEQQQRGNGRARRDNMTARQADRFASILTQCT